MSFTHDLKEKLLPVWQQNHTHPFVEELGQGTLDKEKFRYFMVQDYLYLVQYAKLFAVGAVKAEDVETMGAFAKVMDVTMNEEMSLHRQYAKKFGITEQELEQAEPAPTTLAYTRYMLHEGQNGGLAELLAAVLPCMWSYAEIGRKLSTWPGALEHELYGEWVQMYSDDEFQQLADWGISMLDRLAENKPEAEKRKIENIFLTTTRFEYLFWEMAYQLEDWPQT